jgi:hypothetical protein
LAGYSPGAEQPIWQAEFRKRFGPAARAVRQAYETASFIIPYITATRAGSASNFGYWPEMDSLGLTDHYIRLGTGDDDRFYPVEQYVDDYWAGIRMPKKTPQEIAARLTAMAGKVSEILSKAAAESKELAATRTDLRILAELAWYHAARLRSAEAFQFFRKSGERFYLLRAIATYRKAVAHWESLAAAGGMYYGRMIFNRPPDQVGHWKDELPFLKHDLARLEEIDRLYMRYAEDPAGAARLKTPAPGYSLTMQWREEGSTVRRWPDETPVPSSGSGRYHVQYPAASVTRLFSDLRDERILHAMVRFAPAGEPVRMHASFLGSRANLRLELRYREAGQGFRFAAVEMKPAAANVYAAALPAAFAGKKILYYLWAKTAEDEFQDGSAKEPHPLVFYDPAARGPELTHEDLRECRAGTDLPVEVRVSGRFTPVTVRLHYRHLDQSEDWRVIEMQNAGAARYRAAIPGEFIVPGWDIMYAIEAVDETGAGTYYPDLDVRDPFVVVRTK